MDEYNYSKLPCKNFSNLENLLTQDKRKHKLNLLFQNYGTQEAVLPQILVSHHMFTTFWCITFEQILKLLSFKTVISYVVFFFFCINSFNL